MEYVLDNILPTVEKSSEINLLYCGSRDGWSAEEFHKRCDVKGRTITFVKTSNSYMFAGYTTESWGGGSINKTDKNAKIFALTKNK